MNMGLRVLRHLSSSYINEYNHTEKILVSGEKMNLIDKKLEKFRNNPENLVIVSGNIIFIIFNLNRFRLYINKEISSKQKILLIILCIRQF